MGGRGAGSSRGGSSIPANGADIGAKGVTRTVRAADLLDRGFYQNPDLSASKLRSADAILARGLKPADQKADIRPIRIVVGTNGKLEVDDGRHRLNRAVATGQTRIPVLFVRGGEHVGGGAQDHVRHGHIPKATRS